MVRFATLFVFVLVCVGCTTANRGEVEVQESREVRIVDGLGKFTLEEDEMWEGSSEVDGLPVKVFLHAYETDFEVLAAYAKRILSRNSLPNESMLNDIKRGMESQAWKFDEYGFDPSTIELQRFRIERIVIGKDFDGPDIELGINLSYPDDANQWHLSYSREGQLGSLNWIPKTN